MQKKKIRDLAEMPTTNKFQYFQVLFTMANIDGEINQLELMELYRLMSRVKLLQKERLFLIDNLDQFSEEITKSCERIMDDLKEQEKNILRFSLMKDLIIVMKADYHQTTEEKELFNRLKILFDIRDDQLEVFQEEYKRDRNFFEEDCIESIKNNRLEERFLMGTAIGIPAASIFIKKRREKENCFFIERKTEVSIIDVLKTLSLGVISYHSLKWILGIRNNEEQKLKQHLYKECLKVQDRAIRYVTADIRYLQQKSLHLQEGENKLISTKKAIMLLDKTLSTIKNTKLYLL